MRGDREEALLADELDQVGDRLQQPERARRGSARSGSACGRAACARARSCTRTRAMTRLTITTALIREIHQGSFIVHDLHASAAGRRRARRRCGRRPRAARGSRGRAASTRRPVRADGDVVAVARCRARVASCSDSSTSALRPLELRARGRARRPGRRRAAGSGRGAGPSPRLGAAGASDRLGRPRSRPAAPHARRPRRTESRRRRSPRPPRTRATGTARARRRSAPPASRDPGELVGCGRDDGAAQALDAALEVDVRAVALEVARPRQDEVGPAGGEAVEHRDHEHPLRLLGERADVGVRGGLVAGDDQQADRVRVGRLSVAGARPGVGRRRGRSRSPGGGRRRCAPSRCASAATRGAAVSAGPHQIEDRARRRSRDGRPRRARAATRAPRRRACLDPEVDDRCALDDGVVAEDRDDVGVARSPRAATRKPSSASEISSGKHRGVRVEAPAQQLARARRPARPSRSRTAR